MNVLGVRKICAFLMMFACAGFFPFYADAGVVTIQTLSFGTFLLKRNNSVQNVTVNVDGSWSASAEIIMLLDPQAGIYQVDGLQANSVVQSVTVTQTQTLQCGCSGQVYTMDNFAASATPTNGAGVTTVTIGARARTSGTGQSYGDGVYDGDMSLVFNF